MSPGKRHSSFNQTGKESLHPTLVFRKPPPPHNHDHDHDHDHNHKSTKDEVPGPWERGGLPRDLGSGEGPLRMNCPPHPASLQVPQAFIQHGAGESRTKERARQRKAVWTGRSLLEKAPPGRRVPSGWARPLWPAERTSHKDPLVEKPGLPPRPSD